MYETKIMARNTTFIYHVHIADGFADDCDELLHRCSKREPLTYHAFCHVWKEMNFDSIYVSRMLGAEIAELSEELVHIAKHYMVANTSNFEESVAGVFLVYGVLNLQPYRGFAALRIVPEDMPAINRIEAVARRERRLDVLYILGVVLVKGPCQFHAAQREHGMESSFKKYLDGCTGIDRQGVRPKGVFYRQNEELDIIRELNNLSRRYTEAKAAITGSMGAVDRSLNYTDKNFASDLDTSLKNIINGIIEEKEDATKSLAHYNAVQAIKVRAMQHAVDSMKHLTGVNERASSSKSSCNKPKIRSKPGKIKSESPTKAIKSSSLAKKTTSKKKKVNKKNKRKRKMCSSSSDSDGSLSLASDEESDDLIDLINLNGEQTVHNESKTENKEDEPDIDIEIDSLSLPVLITTDDDTIEIQIIDQYNENESQKDNAVEAAVLPEETLQTKLKDLNEVTIEKIQAQTSNTHRSSIKSPMGSEEMAKISKIPDSDDHVFKKPDVVNKPTGRRDHKKTIVKSKFKRMGILPVANFNDCN